MLGTNSLAKRPPARVKAESRPGTFFASWRGGHTLIELAIAIAIIGVLAGLGAGLLRDQLVTWRLMRSGRLLQNDLHHLRALAMSSNRQGRLRFVAADAAMDPDSDSVGAWEIQLGNRTSGSTVWDTLPLDEGEVDNGAGTRDLGPEGAQDAPGVSLAPWPTLRGPGVDNADTIVLSPRGWVENPSEDFDGGYISLDLVNKRARADGVDQRVRVQLSRTGIARLQHGDSTTVADGAVAAPEASSR